MSLSMILVGISIAVIGIIGALGMYIGKKIIMRLRKRYQELKHEILMIKQQGSQVQQQIQQQVSQVQQQIEQQLSQIQQEIRQIKQHLLLEHMGSMASLAKGANYIDESSLKKALEFIHELEMDNLAGKDMQVTKEVENEK